MRGNSTPPWNRRERKMTPSKLNNSFLFFQICFSISFSFSVIGKEAEGWWEIVLEDIGGVGVTASFIAPWCNNRGGKAAGLRRHGKKA
jgi:hypothetical protein